MKLDSIGQYEGCDENVVIEVTAMQPQPRWPMLRSLYQYYRSVVEIVYQLGGVASLEYIEHSHSEVREESHHLRQNPSQSQSDPLWNVIDPFQAPFALDVRLIALERTSRRLRRVRAYDAIRAVVHLFLY